MSRHPLSNHLHRSGIAMWNPIHIFSSKIIHDAVSEFVLNWGSIYRGSTSQSGRTKCILTTYFILTRQHCMDSKEELKERCNVFNLTKEQREAWGRQNTIKCFLGLLRSPFHSGREYWSSHQFFSKSKNPKKAVSKLRMSAAVPRSTGFSAVSIWHLMASKIKRYEYKELTYSTLKVNMSLCTSRSQIVIV